ncbi:MAG: glycerol-3-phosphate acyltransferase [Chloroflexi bacterium]|nr:glycerol-3-phosphate acyltransferase [Chloroflexota bacterium]MBU1750773.1 glycerol-3-phosphate acyltransferase [Chloroflexota bacterium]
MSSVFALGLVVIAYLLGSIPTAYVIARLARGIDLRQVGSGNVGGSNVYEHVGLWALLLVGVVDIGKALVPTALALWLGFGWGIAGAAGLAAMIGHSWSLYLRFTGGRGIGPMTGLLVVLAPVEFVLTLIVFGLGALLHRESSIGLVGIFMLPVSAWVLGRPPEVVLTGVGIIALILLKRILANDGVPRSREVFWCRLLLDRDIVDREAWIHRA